MSNDDCHECSICMCEISEEDTVSLPCGHNFHGRCIVNWIWEKRSCPICRHAPESANDGVEMTLENIIESIRRTAEIRRSALQRGIRHAARNDASKSLNRQGNLYFKWKSRVTDSTRELREIDRSLVQKAKNLRQSQTQAYKEYREKYKQNIEKYKKDTFGINVQRRRINKDLRSQHRHLQKYESALISSGLPPNTPTL